MPLPPDTGDIGHWLRHPPPPPDPRTGWRPMAEAPEAGTIIDALNRRDGRAYRVYLTVINGERAWVEKGVPGWFPDDAWDGWLPVGP